MRQIARKMKFDDLETFVKYIRHVQDLLVMNMRDVTLKYLYVHTFCAVYISHQRSLYALWYCTNTQLKKV